MTATLAPVAEPIETVTPISPAEAFRLGRLMVPERCEVITFNRDLEGNVIRACALGAMWLGWGKDPDEFSYGRINEMLGGPRSEMRDTQVFYWNDTERLPDDEIARRLEEWS